MRSRRPVVAAVACAVATLGASGAALVVLVNRAESSPSLVPPAAHLARVPAPAPTATVAPAHAPVPAPPITVNGKPVRLVGPTTVGAAVRAARITIRAGRYLSVVHHRRLRSNGQPGGASVNGHRATLRTVVHPGDRIVVHQGPSRLEPTEKVTVRLHPVVRSALYVGGRDGLARVVRGTISHEVVSEQVLRRPRAGHLIQPGAVALTFDDGPSRHWTRAVLALLHRHHAPATFCMIGRQVHEFAWVARRVVQEGNAVCDHTWDHDLALRARPRGQRVLDIRRGYRAIVHWVGVRPRFFRAPGGEWSTSLETIARQQGMTSLKWTVDPRDWTRPGVKKIVHTVLAQLRPGGVILLHDGGGNRHQTLQALSVLLHRLPRLGYHFVLPPSSGSG